MYSLVSILHWFIPNSPEIIYVYMNMIYNLIINPENGQGVDIYTKLGSRGSTKCRTTSA